MKHIISLGAGVQSSTMALMAAQGEITPMPDAAVFADTQWEPKAVYAWLDWLERQLPFPVYRVTAGSLRDSILSKQNTTGGRFAAIPWFLQFPNGDSGMGRRQCTAEHKLGPLHKKLRELCGLVPRQRVKEPVCVSWIGISTDEAQRMKPSTERFAVNRWPLIEAGMSRTDCLRWMEKRGYPTPPKSSCLGCPYHSDAQWREIRDNNPEEWADLLYLDWLIREPVRGNLARQYMHRSLKPLGEVDFRTAEEAGQIDMFSNECEGMCGV